MIALVLFLAQVARTGLLDNVTLKLNELREQLYQGKNIPGRGNSKCRLRKLQPKDR